MASSRRASRNNAASSEAGPSTSNPTVSAQHDEAMIGQEGEDAAFGQQQQEEDEESESLGEEGDVIPGALEGSMPVEGDEEEEEEYESTSQSGTDSLTWISWYCSLAGHEYFAEVSEDFIEDDFNLTGLSQLVPFYKEALEMILDVEPEEETLKIPDMSIVESSAELLYGLIHQRYIITRQGLSQMVAKYEAAHFGYCPRVYCNQTKVLPSGRSDLPGVDGVKLFCPTCVDTYTPPSSRFNGVDGAFFGTTFPHLLFQQHPELIPALPQPSLGKQSPSGRASSASPGPTVSSRASPARDTPTPASPTTESNVDMLDDEQDAPVPWTKPETSAMKLYIPRIYGFKVSERARSGPRMQWLRMRPRDERELDRVNSAGTWKSAAILVDTSADTPQASKSDPSPLFGGAGNAQLPVNATANADQVRPIRSRQKAGAAPATASAPTNVDDQVAPRRAQNNVAAVVSPSRGRRP